LLAELRNGGAALVQTPRNRAFEMTEIEAVARLRLTFGGGQMGQTGDAREA